MFVSIAIIGQAFASIERRDPPPPEGSNGAQLAVDRAWLLAMDKLAKQTSNGTGEAMRAFINAKLLEIDQGSG